VLIVWSTAEIDNPQQYAAGCVGTAVWPSTKGDFHTVPFQSGTPWSSAIWWFYCWEQSYW